jgi:hypothetical protein
MLSENSCHSALLKGIAIFSLLLFGEKKKTPVSYTKGLMEFFRLHLADYKKCIDLEVTL